MRKTFFILFLTFIFIGSTQSYMYAALDFGILKWKKPSNGNGISTQNGYHEDDDPAEANEKAFVKLFNFVPNFNGSGKEKQNFFMMQDVIDPSKIMLNSGEVIHLMGLMTSEELLIFQRENPEVLKPIRRLGTVNMDFLETYLHDKKIRVKFFEDMDSDFEGDRFAYVYLEDGELVNKTLIDAGHAVVSPKMVFDDFLLFEKAEARARADHRGIWR